MMTWTLGVSSYFGVLRSWSYLRSSDKRVVKPVQGSRVRLLWSNMCPKICQLIIFICPNGAPDIQQGRLNIFYFIIIIIIIYCCVWCHSNREKHFYLHLYSCSQSLHKELGDSNKVFYWMHPNYALENQNENVRRTSIKSLSGALRYSWWSS